MTTATGLRAGRRGGAMRCAWGVAVALFAVLAVLVHHDMTPAARPAGAMSAMAGTDHTAAVAESSTVASAGHGPARQVAAAPDMGDHNGACFGAGMQHCSSGDVGAAAFVVPPAMALLDRGHAASGVSAGRGLPGTAHRAPPDLSVLSRLLI